MEEVDSLGYGHHLSWNVDVDSLGYAHPLAWHEVEAENLSHAHKLSSLLAANNTTGALFNITHNAHFNLSLGSR
jgi:hypothetical protein